MNKIEEFKNFLGKYYFPIILSTVIILNPQIVLAGGISETTFKPLIDLIYIVLKVAGAIIALVGMAKLLLSFSNEQPESRYSGVMQILTGMAMFFSSDILGSLGITI